MLPPDLHTPLTTQEAIEILFDNFEETLSAKYPDKKPGITKLCSNFKIFLSEKNRKYGDSALNPKKIFSKVDAEDQICNRLDDKLGRIEKSTELKKNDICDSFGYHALLMIKKGWLEFDDLLE